MTVPVGRDVVDTLARDVVAQVSPAELPLFRATSERYFADPDKAMAARARSDEPLGFGAEAAVVLVGPFALDLVKKVLTRLSEKLGDAAIERLIARLRGKAPAAGPPEPQPLDAAQLALVRETAGAEASRLALPPEQASRLADALVASLATRE